MTALLDAGRGEIYVGEFHVKAGDAKPTREYLVPAGDFMAEQNLADDILTSDPKIAEALSDGQAGVRLVQPIHADEIGRIGLRKLLAGDTADAATVDVNYIRRSDAEMFSPPRPELVLIRKATPDDLPLIRTLEQQSETAAHWGAARV